MFKDPLASVNWDYVNDFVSGTDKLVFDDAIFTSLGGPGSFAAGDERSVAAPGARYGVEPDDRLMYDTGTGKPTTTRTAAGRALPISSACYRAPRACGDGHHGHLNVARARQGLRDYLRLATGARRERPIRACRARAVARLRPFFFYAGCSASSSTLLLVPPLYMLQVFDRVLASRSAETLAVLSVAAVVALLIMAILDVLRARLLAAAGAVLDRMLGPSVIDGLLAQTAKLSSAAHLNGLRDVNTLRSFLGGTGLMTLFDAPWLPFFLLVIFLFHPILGAVAAAGALLMMLLALANERLTRGPLERAQSEGRRAARFIDANVRNAEVVSALGMLPAVTRRWARLNDAALAEQGRAARAGGFCRRDEIRAPAYPDRDAGRWRLSRRRAGRERRRDDRRNHPSRPGACAGRDSGCRLAQPRRCAQRLASPRPAPKDTPASERHTELPAPKGKLEVEKLVFGLKDKAILRGVSFKLESGEALALVGPSASGKSTLARLRRRLEAARRRGAARRRRRVRVAARRARPAYRLPAAGRRALRRHGGGKHRTARRAGLGGGGTRCAARACA